MGQFWIGCAIISDSDPLWQKCEMSSVDRIRRSGIPSGCEIPMRVFRWYRPMGSTTGYNLPSRRDEEVSRWCYLGETVRGRSATSLSSDP